MDIYFRKWMSVFGLAASLWLTGEFLTGCGGAGQNANLVKNVTVQLQTIQGDMVAVLDATLDTGAVVLPSVTLPIFDPNNSTIHYGQVSMMPALGGGTALSVSVDLTTTAHLASTVPTLPNGTPLPIGGISNVPVISLPLGGSQGAELYLTFTQSVAMVGFALPIQELQAVGNVLGGVNFFPSFLFPDGIQGIAGVFTGTGATGSGLALFFDFSSVIPKPPVSAKMLSLAAPSAPVTLQFSDVVPGDYEKNAISRTMYKLNRKGAKLHIQ